MTFQVMFGSTFQEFHYRWEYDFKLSSEQLWRFVADTNRFNRDAGIPSIESNEAKRSKLRNTRRRLRLSVWGMPLEWEEQPFEWLRPCRFGVVRTYSKGPMAELRVLAQLVPRSDSGTRLIYEVWAKPKSLLGFLAIPLQLGLISKRRFGKAFRRYDQQGISDGLPDLEQESSQISSAGQARLDTLKERLLSQEAEPHIVARLVNFIEKADDLSLARIRPYALADEWQESRRAVLETCLWATRIGLLDLQWDLLCPSCRGPQESSSSLRDISTNVHCEACRIDFTVSFDRFVELTFRPNAALRPVDVKNYCIGSPQRTPHVIAQQLLAAKADRVLTFNLEEGSYRVRGSELAGEQEVKVTGNGSASAIIRASLTGMSTEDLCLSTNPTVRFENATDEEQLFILERTAWTEQAATAAEVTALQVFRDLFSSEALRPGEQISVGTLTVLFTDLRNSTRLYREIGDATAFGRVMNHFDVLKKAIAEADGALVKTIGDAVMAVFRHPADALRAILLAQRVLAAPMHGSQPLTLKAGIHSGPCIAVTLNDRLDYFGSTVNMAARLEGLSTGDDVIISGAVYDDPEIRGFLNEPINNVRITSFEMPLKGFDEERFELWRVARIEAAAKSMAGSSSST
jgi:class 3 adenylate cyclase